jgi:2,3-bisphosphoglycerate-independent phosphoglycerate mutase
MTNNKQQTEMNKEFAPYELALELKELGFDEPCLAYWDNNKLFVIDRNSGRIQKNSNYKDIFEGIISAPLYQQAFRWFREKYDLDYSLLPESSSGHKLSTRTFNIVIYKYYMNMNVQAEIVIIDGKIGRYNKREEAEIACLRKLIEIVKQKQ